MFSAQVFNLTNNCDNQKGFLRNSWLSSSIDQLLTVSQTKKSSFFCQREQQEGGLSTKARMFRWKEIPKCLLHTAVVNLMWNCATAQISFQKKKRYVGIWERHRAVTWESTRMKKVDFNHKFSVLGFWYCESKVKPTETAPVVQSRLYLDRRYGKYHEPLEIACGCTSQSIDSTVTFASVIRLLSKKRKTIWLAYLKTTSRLRANSRAHGCTNWLVLLVKSSSNLALYTSATKTVS